VVTAVDIRRLLAGRELPVPSHDSDPLNLDSLSVAWLLHSVDLEFGVELDGSDDHGSFVSIEAIVAYVNESIVDGAD